MPIYVLRHERRFSSPKFFTSLTTKGLDNSELLVDKIKKLHIDLVYCSPFLRTIQTILPYIEKYDKKLNIEYALYEAVKGHTFTREDFLHDYTELYGIDNRFEKNINSNYASFLSKKDIDYPEDLEKIYNRLIPFLEYIKENYKDKNILLVTHMSTALVIKEYLVNKRKLKTDKDPTGTLFPMGHVEKVYN